MFCGRRPFADIAGLLAPVRINRLVHTVSVMVDPDLTYRYPCPTAFGACHYIYPTMTFFFFYAMALSCLWPIARDRATKPSGPQTRDQPYSVHLSVAAMPLPWRTRSDIVRRARVKFP
jgi:hypothetical protein